MLIPTVKFNIKTHRGHSGLDQQGLIIIIIIIRVLETRLELELEPGGYYVDSS